MNQLTHHEISQKIAGTYHGDVVVSDNNDPIQLAVTVTSLSDSLANLSFDIEGQSFSMMAILSEEGGDIHMIIQEKVTEDFILNGVTGFLCKKPNVHGGFISELKGLYFHILLNHFGGSYLEVYFFGKAAKMQAVAV